MEGFNLNEIEDFEAQDGEMVTHEDIPALQSEMMNELDTDVEIIFDGSTYEVDNNEFTLSFTINDDVFEIRNIEMAREGEISGSEIITIIHDFCDEHGWTVHAANIKDGAEGFWEKMGYEASGAGSFERID